MTCPVCGGGNPHEAQFCTSCGMPLGSQGTTVPREDATVGLAPRDISGLVQETLRIYRADLKSFLLIALVPQVPLIPLAFVAGTELSTPVIVAFAFSLVLSVLAKGATVFAVSRRYLGRPLRAVVCFERAWTKMLALVLSTLAFVLAIFGAAITMIGIPLAIYLATVWFFYAESIILERQGPLASLWHSRDFVRGSFWRVLGIGLTFTAIGLGGLVAATTAAFIFDTASPVLGGLVYTAVLMAIAPVMWIGVTLAYFDLRVRKNGYSIENLAQEMGEA